MFMDVTFFGKQAETVNQYLRKGSHVLLAGEIDFQQWEDRNGGGKRSKHVLNANFMQMLDKKGDGGARNDAQNEQADRYSGGQQQQQQSYQQPAQNQSYQQPQQGQQQQQQSPQQGQQQSYQQPAQQQQQPAQQQNQNQNQPQQQQRQLPVNDVPVIDIDEDEIPF